MTALSDSPDRGEAAMLSGRISTLPRAAAGWPGPVARAAAFLSSALGLAVIIGWHAGVVLPSSAPMQLNTALGFLLGGAALHFATVRRRRLATALSAVVAVLGLLTLLEHAAGSDVGIDRLFMEPYVTVRTHDPGRMSPLTAVAFVAVAAAIATLLRWNAGVCGTLGAALAAIGFSTLIGYLIADEIALGWQQPTHMAIHTAAGFLVLGLGLLSLASREASVRVMGTPRWWAVAAATFLATVGLAVPLAVQRLELRDGDQTSAMTVITVLAGLITALLMGVLIDQARVAHIREDMFRSVVEWAPHARVGVNAAGTVVLMNAEAEQILGYPREELIGRSVDVLVPDRFLDGHTRHRQAYLRAPEARALGGGRTLYAKRRDGREFPADISLSPIWSNEGLVVLASIIDATERVALESAQRALNRDLEELVAQRTAALAKYAQELQRANLELRRSNADLQQFAYVASHDLQEPLRQVASYTQLLARRYRGRLDADADEFIGFVVDGAQRMRRLILALLSYSRIGHRASDFPAVDCNELLNRVLADLEITIDQAGAAITRETLPTVNADGDQLSMVLQNLISNAIKFRDPARRPDVHLGVASRQAEWIFSVRDNGIGIAPRFLERIFVIFQRLHTATEYPGTGIGLAICKRVIERHGGRIWVESRPGSGSTFYFTLPNGNLPPGAAGGTTGRTEESRQT